MFMNIARQMGDPNFFEKFGYAVAVGSLCLLFQLYCVYLMTRGL